MYSGGDSTDAQSYNQWALNPSAYQNMANEQVDWAALAQQWIIMKEAGPPVPEPPTVMPSPNATKAVRKDVTAEGGEAPMEVENESEENRPQWNDGTGSGDSWKWQSQPPQPWNWENTWNNPGASNNATKPPLLPTPPNYNQYNSNLDNTTENSSYGYNSTSNYQSGYWTSSGGAKVIKPHNKRYSKVNVPTTVANTAVPPPKVVNLDAAKRKQLPAWIREGLEKMERDKLKQLDREREKQEKAECEAKRKLYEKNALEILKDTVKEQQIKSRFDSASEESEDDIEGRSLTPEIQQPVPQPQRLTQEEMTVLVRRTMTEILLKVTNREIYTICKEELERYEKRKKASDQRVSAPTGANLSARLGLGAYGESDSENTEVNSDDDDSDVELKEEIKRKKAEFAKVERAIEEKLAELERRRDVKSQSRGNSPVNNDNKDSQVDAKTPDGSSTDNQKTKRTHRNSSSTDSKESKDKSKYARDSSLSDSSSSIDDYRKSRSRSRSRDRDRKQSYRSERKYSRSSRRSSRSSERKKRSRSISRTRRQSSQSSRRDHRGRSRSDSRSRSRSRSKSYVRSRNTRSTSRSRRRSSSRSYSRRQRSRSRRRSPSSSRRSSHRGKRSRSRSSGRDVSQLSLRGP